MEKLAKYFESLCLIIMFLKSGAFGADGIKGSLLTCNVEGMPIKLDKNFLCYSCICKNRFIECQPKVCPKNEDCSNPSTKASDPCCPSQCKGCWYNESLHESGDSWRSPNDPCTQLTCRSGVITEAMFSCYTPCDNPLPPLPGQCCHRCPTCSLRGQSMGPGTELRPTEDPCLTCVCDSQGLMTCSKIACPVLNCNSRNQIKNPGQCCYRCQPGGSMMMPPPRGVCILEKWMLKGPQEHPIDSCSRCRCLQGGKDATVLCISSTCPPLLGCPAERQRLLKPSDCCKSCPPSDEEHVSYSGSKCIMKGVSYQASFIPTEGNTSLYCVGQDGESWQLNACISCQCDKGVVKCARADCALSSSDQCPRNHKLTKLPGKCCPECVEKDGRCLIFGGHFRTFDERHFSFQGECKYQLALDCSSNHSFAVRMSTAPAGAAHGVRSKLVTIKVGRHRVTLGHRLKTKVDGVRVTIPYHLTDVLELSLHQNNVLLTTSVGLKVLWNGNTLLELSVPPTMRSKLCGLCGNYNGKASDDLTTRSGQLVHRADEFAHSWRIGGAKSCPKTSHRSLANEQSCNADAKKQNRDYRKCTPIRSNMFQVCHAAVPAMRYYKVCINEMCRCPSRRRCHCDVFEAYMRECLASASNVSPSLEKSWRYITGCYQSRASEPSSRTNIMSPAAAGLT